MSVRVNVDFIAQQGEHGVVLSATVNLRYGPEGEWCSLPPTSAIIPAVLAENISSICANAATFATMCSFTSSTDENAANEKQGK